MDLVECVDSELTNCSLLNYAMPRIQRTTIATASAPSSCCHASAANPRTKVVYVKRRSHRRIHAIHPKRREHRPQIVAQIPILFEESHFSSIGFGWSSFFWIEISNVFLKMFENPRDSLCVTEGFGSFDSIDSLYEARLIPVNPIISPISANR